jgi:PAS domain S-box-containing protein
MIERFLILLLTTGANLLFGFVVWSKNSSDRVNQYFALFSVAVAAWTLSNGLVATFADTPWGILWARSAFASASLLPLSFFLFVTVFPAPRPVPPRALPPIWLLLAIVAFLASFTDLIAQQTFSRNGVLSVRYGPLHPFFAMYFMACLGYSLFLLYQKLHLLTGVARLQVRYVFLAVLLSVAGGTVMNLVIPLTFGSSRFSPYGPLFSILMLAIIAHAIIRHRLMHIRVVIRRGVAYLLAAAILGGTLVASFHLLSRLTVQWTTLPVWVAVLLALFAAVVFQPLKREIQAWVDRYFFREPYDYQRVLRETSRTIAGILDLNDLLEYVCETISRTLRPEYRAVYIRDAATQLYRRIAFYRDTELDDIDPPNELPTGSCLITHLAATKTLQVADDLSRLRHDGRLRDVLHEMRRSGADVALPLLDGNLLAGVLLVSRKRSGDPYFSDDLDLLTTIVGQAAVAIKNAQLYSQVVLAGQHIENILRTIESAVIAVSAQGLVTLFNPAAERLTALQAETVRNQPAWGLPSAVAVPLELTLKDGLPRLQVEATIESPTGHLIPVICSTSPLHGRTGTTFGAVAVISDLTRLRQLEAEKRQVEQLASIGALAAGIAHEIRNPLVAIKTFAELLPERYTDEDFRHGFAQVVITEIERINDLVGRLKGLAAGPKQAFAPLDLREPIGDTLALLRGQLEQRQITATLTSASDLPPVAADVAQLKQLFLNLFVNAIEAMRPGGALSVRIACRQNGAGTTVFVEVSDTGTGIPENLLSQIFEPFITTKERGSGLGLSISRGIAAAHKASIRARNNTGGKGATITVEFPVTESIRDEIPTLS